MDDTYVSPFEVLGVNPGTSDKDIAAAFRRHARRHHPDVGGDPEAFTRVALAFEQLTNPQSRFDAIMRDREAAQDQPFAHSSQPSPATSPESTGSSAPPVTPSSVPHRRPRARQAAASAISMLPSVWSRILLLLLLGTILRGVGLVDAAIGSFGASGYRTISYDGAEAFYHAFDVLIEGTMRHLMLATILAAVWLVRTVAGQLRHWEMTLGVLATFLVSVLWGRDSLVLAVVAGTGIAWCVCILVPLVRSHPGVRLRVSRWPLRRG